MPKRKHIVLIIHGSRAELPGLRHLVEWVRGKGHIVTPRITWEGGDATNFAREFAAAGADSIVAVGGDGTVNEVINGLDGSDVPMGIIPMGTANDFARQVGIPLDVDHAMDVILQHKPVRIDTAELNGRRYLNVSVAGVGAEATAETPAEAKEQLGMLAYFITGMRKLAELEPQHARFTGPGFSHECDFFIFAVGNGRSTGGGTTITPKARANDGLLDLCIVEAMPRGEFARLVLKIKGGEHVDDDSVRYVQLPSIDVQATSPVTVNVDGEPMCEQHLQYRARARDLKMHLVHMPGDPDAA
jgi:lipid kinase YegS